MKTNLSRQNVRRQQVRQAVRSLHERLRDLGEYRSPIPVERVAQLLDVRVAYVETEDDDLSGFFYRDPQTGRSVIGINDAHSKTRQRFTLAHELGHLMLHSFDDLHYDRKGQGGIMRRDSESAMGENRDEVEANFFAAELLMPVDLIREKLEQSEVSDIFERNVEAALRSIAKEFNVSSQALTIRLAQLGLISIE